MVLGIDGVPERCIGFFVVRRFLCRLAKRYERGGTKPGEKGKSFQDGHAERLTPPSALGQAERGKTALPPVDSIACLPFPMEVRSLRTYPSISIEKPPITFNARFVITPLIIPAIQETGKAMTTPINPAINPPPAMSAPPPPIMPPNKPPNKTVTIVTISIHITEIIAVRFAKLIIFTLLIFFIFCFSGFRCRSIRPKGGTVCRRFFQSNK